MIDLNLYRVFYEVAKCGSLTKAADEVHMSQPAVSQTIKTLESTMGVRLFNRISRGMELTDTGGKQLFDIVEKALSILDAGENMFKERRNIASGQIRISASDTVVTHFLMRYIKKYHDLHPNVSITFRNSTTKDTLELVKTGRADIGMVNLPIYDKDVTLTGQTGIIEDIFVASEAFSGLFEKNISLRELPNYPILLLDPETSTTKEINQFLDGMGIKIVPEFEAGSMELLVEMAKNGLGIACIPRRYILEELAKKELYELKVSPSLPLRATGVIIKGEVEEHPFAVREFIKVLDDDQYNEA